MGVIKPIPKSLMIKGGTVYDPVTGKSIKRDIAVVNGKIADADKAGANAEVLDANGWIITTGFTDIHVHFREPGREDKESLATGANAALAGGFTRVCTMPNTHPPVDSPEDVTTLIKRAADLPITILPIGAITTGQKGQALAEILGMHDAGAVAFSDDGQPLADGQVLRMALEYTKAAGSAIINHAEDCWLRGEGVMNEGALSTRMGLPGNPVEAEAAMVYRDILIAEQTGGKLHVPHVSTALAVDLIRQAKARGVALTAEATPHHLGLTENLISDFSTHAKVAPPLRPEADRAAVVIGLSDGTIDCIATDHAPHTVEEKEMDMLNAPFGMIGLESAFGLAHTTLIAAGFSTEEVINLMSIKAANIFGLETGAIENGAVANLVVISPGEEWEFALSDIHSRSRNTPMLGMKFKGRVKATITDKAFFQQFK